jgi:2-isopropylmalate synthase
MMQPNWNANEYTKHAAFVPSFANDVMNLLAPQLGEKILDIGCGDGALTLKLQAQGCQVIGIDASASMVKATQNRGVEAYVVDGHYLDFKEEFDAVFSNAALHWLTEPEKVIAGVYRSLKPNGRFVAEMGGAGNIAALLSAMQTVFQEHSELGEFKSPWYFPTVAEYKQLLEQAGFSVSYIELIPRLTPLTSGIEKWLEIFAEGIIHHLTTEQKQQFLKAVRENLLNTLYTEHNGWVADYVRLRFKATKV